MQNEMTKHIYKRVFLSSSLTTFSLIGAGFIDSVIISRFLGTDAVAAAGLAYPFYFLQVLFTAASPPVLSRWLPES